ncbi:glycosyltransferase [Geobacillus stearothermophilus]|uniref:glycosyltransferase n=1 Tax=Geobacillus stearothermophilus TaxID=1422 RepID=UPI0024026ED4|nr:glycosyltransferase [Geobacillus stearothermophilus]MDF9296664.1 glycosyltransferase [Geobacillus stearothermophilus]
MKILYISGAFPPMKCGVGDYLYQLLSEIRKMPNLDISLITSVGCIEQMQGVSIYPIIKRWDFTALPQIIKTVKEIRPDIVHIQYPTIGYKKYLSPSFLPALLKILGIKKIVQTWHEPLSKKGLFRYFPNTLVDSIIINVESDYLNKLPSFYAYLLKKKSRYYIPISSNIPISKLDNREKLSLRKRIFKEQYDKNIIAYFGFVTPNKGLEYLFEAANPEEDCILLICELKENDKYHDKIRKIINSSKWKGNVEVTGYLPDKEVANYLSIADMAVFPFIKGCSERNGSVLAARLQNTFVITTSFEKKGYFENERIYYVHPKSKKELEQAIVESRKHNIYHRKHSSSLVKSWSEIAKMHVDVYKITKRNNQKRAENGVV